MTSATLTCMLFATTLAAYAPLHELRAGEGPETTRFDTVTRSVSAPDKARIASDLTGHYFFGGTAAIGGGTTNYGPPESTAIRSSVRDGEVLEYRVSSLFHEGGGRQHRLEVDSIVRYRMSGDRWSLIDVRTEGTSVQSGSVTKAGESC